MNIKILNFVILYIFLVGCINKKDISKNIIDRNCFEKNNVFIYLNIINKENFDIKIPKIQSILDSNLYLHQSYFNIVEDTLKITMTNSEHIGISHNKDSFKIEVKNPEIKLEKGKSIRQFFKINEEFQYIILDERILFTRCN